jgi:hypothetical protein
METGIVKDFDEYSKLKKDLRDAAKHISDTREMLKDKSPELASLHLLHGPLSRIAVEKVSTLVSRYESKYWADHRDCDTANGFISSSLKSLLKHAAADKEFDHHKREWWRYSVKEGGYEGSCSDFSKELPHLEESVINNFLDRSSGCRLIKIDLNLYGPDLKEMWVISY